MGDKWKNYLGVYYLRNHGLLNNVPKTEMIINATTEISITTQLGKLLSGLTIISKLLKSWYPLSIRIPI